MTAQLFAHPVQPRDTDERWTPPWLFDVMAEQFDLDVAAPPGGVPWLPAARHYHAADDGLAQPWTGLVWCNPPFSDAGPWAYRFTDHANGVALLPWNGNATWLHDLCRAVRVVVTLEHVKFAHPTHTGRHVPVAVALFPLGARGEAAALRVAAADRGVAFMRGETIG
jgi:hypothetical protein